ncbi:hypothetical protein CPT31_19145 [Enterobacter hormaechei]|nr:hypothetical protein CPT31_19145 [Enterobacter hormaechei]
MTPKSLAYAPVRERFFNSLINFQLSREWHSSDQRSHATLDNRINLFSRVTCSFYVSVRREPY